MLRRRDLLKAAGALAGFTSFGAERKPNLLVMEASGWRANDPNISAPNLERLAEEGIRFERAYSCCPMPGASQAALLTGRFPWSSSGPTLGEVLRNAGYRTGFAGRQLIERSRTGFDYRGTDLGIDFLKQKSERPFFLFVVLDGPRTGPLRSARVHVEEGTFRLDPNVPEDFRAQAQSEYALYTGLCSKVDQATGNLLAALEEAHLTGETIVVFTSGYGEMLSSQGLEDGDVPFEEAVHVPLVIRHPGLRSAARRPEFFVSNVDIMPTLLGFCNVAIPEGVQGRDLSALISLGEGSRPESVYAAGHIGASDEWRMVVRGLDKLVEDRKLEVTDLFNLGTDPYELDNRAADPSLELKRDELKALVRDWMRRTGDGMDPSGLKKRG